MQLKERIFRLLEPDERRKYVLTQAKQRIDERFENHKDCFHDIVWIPFLDGLCDQFRAFGRATQLSPELLRNAGLFPKFYMVMPDEGTLRYWIEIKQIQDRFRLKRFLSVEKPNVVRDKQQVPSHKSELLLNLSGITTETLLQDFIDQYELQVFKRPMVPSG
jgi:hypothetical protein